MIESNDPVVIKMACKTYKHLTKCQNVRTTLVKRICDESIDDACQDNASELYEIHFGKLYNIDCGN